MTHHDTARNIHIKFTSVKQRDKFLAKLYESEQARMRGLVEGKAFKERFK